MTRSSDRLGADSPLPHERGELRVILVIGDREQDALTGLFLCIPKTGRLAVAGASL